jgi:hypothetical protein
MLFVGGLPSQLNPTGYHLPVQLSWDNGAPLFIAEHQRHDTLQPGAGKVVNFSEDFRLAFSYSEGGALKVTAIEGSYRLIIQPANGLTVDLEEGCKVTLTLDLKRDAFVARTDSGNPATLAVALDGGAPVVSLEPDRYLSFTIGH